MIQNFDPWIWFYSFLDVSEGLSDFTLKPSNVVIQECNKVFPNYTMGAGMKSKSTN